MENRRKREREKSTEMGKEKRRKVGQGKYNVVTR